MFSRGRYNALLTAAEFVSLDVLKRYWTERYGWGALYLQAVLALQTVKLSSARRACR